MLLDIPEKLYARLLEVSQEASVKILLESLDMMQGYNGQSQTEVIMDVIGARKTPNGWVIPSVEELNKKFDI